MTFLIKDFYSKFDQIRSSVHTFLKSHELKILGLISTTFVKSYSYCNQRNLSLSM